MYIQIYTPQERAAREAAALNQVLRLEVQAVYTGLTAWVDDRLWQIGVPLTATEYRNGKKDRYEEGLGIFEAGMVALPTGYGQAFMVKSSRQAGVEYLVYVGCVPGHEGWHCECRDVEGWAAIDCAGVCKHIVAAMISYYVMNSLALEGRKEAA